MTEREFRIRRVAWEQAKDQLMTVRYAVFVIEQGVPMALEQDAHDATASHVLAEDLQGKPLGTARLLPDGHIGRLAVMKEWRGRGIGHALMEALIAQAKERGFTEVILHAQLQALDFYRRFGFRISSEAFLEAGIMHSEMRRSLQDD